MIMDYKIAINTTSKLYFLLLTGIKTARNVEYSVTLNSAKKKKKTMFVYDHGLGPGAASGDFFFFFFWTMDNVGKREGRV